MIAQRYKALLDKKNIMALAGIVVGVLVIISLLYLPPKKAITKDTLEYKSLQAQLSLGYQNLNIFQRNGVTKKLVSQKEIASVIDAITKEGRKLLLNFKSMSRQELIEADASYSLLPVQIAVEGDYKQLGLFLGALEALNGVLISVDSFQIVRDERIFPKLLFSLTLHIYLTKG